MNFVSSQISKNGTNLELVEKVASSLLHGIANLVSTSSFDASMVNHQGSADWDPDESKREKVVL